LLNVIIAELTAVALFAWIVIKMVITKVIKSFLKRLSVDVATVEIHKLGKRKGFAKIIQEKQYRSILVNKILNIFLEFFRSFFICILGKI
jgi:hypothetical protein